MTDKTKKPLGKFILKSSSIPIEIREYTSNKLSSSGLDPKISTARENGSYYGKVLLNSDKYLVQSIGSSENSAVIHSKENISLQGSTLNELDLKKQMNGFNIQVHYSGSEAKAYPYKSKERGLMSSKDLIRKATQYADKNISDVNQRKAFLKHLGKATQQAQAIQRDLSKRNIEHTSDLERV